MINDIVFVNRPLIVFLQALNLGGQNMCTFDIYSKILLSVTSTLILLPILQIEFYFYNKIIKKVEMKDKLKMEELENGKRN